jgi:membrane-bound serine protease (ClpP class)
MSRIIFKTLRLAFFVALLAVALLPNTVSSAAGHSVKVLRVEGIIVPVVADYIDRGIEEAEARGNTIVIIELDTPGGLLDTTQKIVERILNAQVPVVVYVSPAGGWAGSAGTFITIASHIAAMAPGSRIGAATPVPGGGEELSEEMQRKITEDTAAFIRSIAELRGRNPKQAELAVREGKSYTVTEAIEGNLVDLQASTLEELISQLNGMKVTLITGEEVVLNTESYGLDRTEMSLLERFLLAISNPNIAYILLSVGSIGIIAEIYNPGAIFPGIIGAISLIIAFYSLGVLNASLGGILLIVLAFGLFIGEVLTTSFGLFTAGGIAALVLGSLFLFPKGGLEGSLFQVDWRLITGVVIAVTLVFTFVISRIIRAHRRQAATGREELVGKTALVKVALEPEGTVLFKGENWTAIAKKGKVKAGEEVIITGVDGLTLRVTKKQKGR